MSIFQSTFILLLFILIRSGDLAISAATSRDVIRAICYGIVAILALIAIILSLGIH